MNRRLLNLATAVSLIAMLAIIAAWVLSPWGWNRGFDPNDRPPDAEPKSQARFIASEAGSAGGVRFMRQSVTCDPPVRHLYGDAGILGYIVLRDGRSVAGIIAGLRVHSTRGRMGFGAAHYAMLSPNPEGGSFRIEYSIIAIPYWPLLALTAIAPALWLRERWIRHRRQKLGLCLTCAYDLRAHTPGDRCPECGTVPPARVTSQSCLDA